VTPGRERRLALNLSLAVLVVRVAAAGADPDPLESPASVRRTSMDYGPTLTYTVGLPALGPGTNANIALKGLGVRLGTNDEAAICFDTDLLRYYAGWTRGFLDLSRTHLTSSKGSHHALIQGEVQFTTRVGPGWSRGNNFDDPRPLAAGPLPPEWGKFHGVFHHGNRVIFHYSVAGTGIWEMPGVVASNGMVFFTRTLHVERSDAPLTLRLSDTTPVQRAAGDPEGRWAMVKGLRSSAWAALDSLGAQRIAGLRMEATPEGRLQVNLPAIRTPITFTVFLWNDVTSGFLAPFVDGILATPFGNPREYCEGGPARWVPALTTRGRPGSGGPYVVDTATIPEENPWHSWMRLTAFDFFADGRAAVATWNGDVWLVSGLERNLERVTWKRFATGLFEPLGLKIVDEEIWVLCRDQLMRLRDLNGDGEADYYECVNNDTWVGPSYHAFAFDLQTDRAGNFYYIRCGQRVDPLLPLSGAMVKVTKDGRRAEVFASGLRAANGMSVGPHDEITCADNQGNWIPSSRINWVRPGGFYGYLPHAGRNPPPTRSDPPLCWLPMSIDNSSGGQVWVTSDHWGPFAGELLHTSYGKAALFLVLTEEVDGEKQGGVVPFPLKFDSGIQRARFHPRDGQLWVCGLKGWQTSGPRDGALQRVRFTGGAVRMPSALHVVSNGLQLSFTAPLDESSADDVQNYAIEQWNYAWTEKYGSPDFSVLHPDQTGRDPVMVKSARLLADRRTVFLELPEIRPVMQMKIQFRLKFADGTTVAQTIHNTINRLPK